MLTTKTLEWSVLKASMQCQSHQTTFHTTNVSGCTEGEMRLAGGANNNEGRVEICLSDEWGTVCDQMWDETDARVVCRQLGLASSGTKLHFMK